MEWPLPEDKGGADDDAGDDKGGYNNGDFSDSKPMPSEEQKKEEARHRVGGIRREFAMQELSHFLNVATAPQRREDTVSVTSTIITFFFFRWS